MTAYEVTTEPPFEAGTAKLTVALRLPVKVATTEVGADGAPTIVVIEFEAVDGKESPIELVATTVKVYEVPGCKPVIRIVPLPDCSMVPVMPPGEEVAVYEVIPKKSPVVGAINETLAVVAPVAVATTDVGASGATKSGMKIPPNV